jgi:hypothetical protein
METALVGLALPALITKLKEVLNQLGFKVQSLNDKKPVLLAEQQGNWYRSPKQILLQFSRLEDQVTRIDVTVIIENNRKNRRAEEVIEEKIVETIYETVHTRKKTRYGI